MIVWIASYPRSGNTFFRILIHELYGLPTYSGFLSGDDISLDFPDLNPTGHKILPKMLRRAIRSGNKDYLIRALDYLEKQSDVFFIKTHSTIEELHNTKQRAIVLVRDGRDVVVSFGWYLINVQKTMKRFGRLLRQRLPRLWRPHVLKRTVIDLFQRTLFLTLKLLGFNKNLWEFIVGHWLVRNDRWSKLPIGYLDRKDAKTSLVKFEELIIKPIQCVTRALKELDVDLQIKNQCVSTFEELKKIHPKFFRSGTTGTWMKELSKENVKTFMEHNKEVMERFGYFENQKF